MHASIIRFTTCLALVVPALAGCEGSTHIVGSDDSGTDAGKGASDDGGTGVSHDAGKGLSDDAGKGLSDDAGPQPSDGGVCSANTIAFGLTVATTNPVCTAGSRPPWPAGSFGCDGWLTIAPAGQPQSSLNMVSGGCMFPCAAAQPEPPVGQSFKWDGTYFPQLGGPDSACNTPACAPAGSYVATICVGYADPDAGTEGCFGDVTPTCKEVTFEWPPAGDQTIGETITPTPDGG